MISRSLFALKPVLTRFGMNDSNGASSDSLQAPDFIPQFLTATWLV
jgi:hypothetical protein